MMHPSVQGLQPPPAAPTSVRSPNLAGYQVGNPQQLPLPPVTPAGAGHVAPTLGPASVAPTHPHGLADAGFPVQLARPYSPRRKSQIVYLVLGLSVLVAVLLVMLLWALFLR